MSKPVPPESAALARAARTLLEGGILAYPTEAVFGLGCNPRSEAAIRRLLTLKGRPQSRGLILIAADLAQLEPFLMPMEEGIRRQVVKTWPGPLTWLLRARPEVPRLLRGDHQTLAVRVTAHPVASELCRRAGMAIVSTSANPSGSPPARSAAEALAYFHTRVDVYLSGAVDTRAGPTEIRDPYTGSIHRAATDARENP